MLKQSTPISILWINMFIRRHRTEFLPGIWDGTYKCPAMLIQTFVLNVTRVMGNINVIAELTIQGATNPITGTYASFFKALTLQVGQVLQIVPGQDITSLEINAMEENTTYMRGAVVFPARTGAEEKTNCNAVLWRRTGIQVPSGPPSGCTCFCLSSTV
jgi:hypothetical protein